MHPKSVLALALLYCVSRTVSAFTSADCEWIWVEQPIDHFDRSVGHGFRQRLCVYDKFWAAQPDRPSRPVFFYTGNEAPVEIYVNNTGLMWDLAPKHGALLVFAEHRYFGESVPTLKGEPDCLAHLSSTQALADYAVVVDHVKQQYDMGPTNRVVAFGGSYGGMLAAWFRYKYPHVCNGGAVASSAPVVGFPFNNPSLDGGFHAITRGARFQYPGQASASRCPAQMLALWPLISELATVTWGRDLLSDVFGTCTPLKRAQDGPLLVEYIQQMFFGLGEGNFPFSTNYISFALFGTLKKFPKWPMHAVCAVLDTEYPKKSISVSGTPQDVKFDVVVSSERNDKELIVSVDWRNATSNVASFHAKHDIVQHSLLPALGGMKRAIDIYYNVTESLRCHDFHPRETVTNSDDRVDEDTSESQKAQLRGAFAARSLDATGECTATEIPPLVAWEALTCNDEINLVQYGVKGAGRDMFWPPSTKTRQYTQKDVVPGMLDTCASFAQRNPGLYGAFTTPDPYAKWMETVYGGTGTYDGPAPAASRIIFANGLFDPWSAAGVLPEDGVSQVDVDGITKLVIPDGAHHNDLFFPSSDDTAATLHVRKVQAEVIASWVGQ